MTLSEIAGASTTADCGHRVSIRRKPRYIDTRRVQGLRRLRESLHRDRAGSVQLRPDDRRAAHIPFPGAVPTRRCSSARELACTYACPAGIQNPMPTSRSSGAAQYEKAFTVVLEATPLAGSLGRACFAFCEASAPTQRWTGRSRSDA